MDFETHPIEERRRSGLRLLKTKVEHSVDPERKSITEELGELYKSAVKLNISELPKVLELRAGDNEYVSVRRVDDNRIDELDHPNENPFFHIKDYRIDAGLVGEGQIGVLFLPSVSGASPVSGELKVFLESQDDVENHAGWSSLLPMSIDRGRPFKLNEWELAQPNVALVKRYNDELYVRGWSPESIFVPDSKTGKKQIVLKTKPDEDGKITLATKSFWWSEEEIGAQETMDGTLGRFYVLVQGSSDKEKQTGKERVANLNPQLGENTL